MLQIQHRRGWLLIALIAIGVALVLLMAPQAHGPDHGALVAILPLLFISPLSLLSPLAYLYIGRTPDAPSLPVVLQRPPPFPLA